MIDGDLTIGVDVPGAGPREMFPDSLLLTADNPLAADRFITVLADRGEVVTRLLTRSVEPESILGMPSAGFASAAIRRLITGRLATGIDIAGLLTGSVATPE